MIPSTNEQTLLQTVEHNKKAILEEIATCTAKLVGLKQRLSDLDGFLRIYQTLVPTDSNVQYATDNGSKRRSKTEAIESAVVELLMESKALPIRDIVQRLEQMKISVGGKRPEMNVSAILSKSARFIYTRAAGGWSLIS